MNFSKIEIEAYAKETGFIKHNLEKVIRLLHVLDFIFDKSSFKDKVILKGGTAINLVHTNLKRLSVDIDLDYCGSLDKETAFKDRDVLAAELDKYMISENYQVSQKSRTSVALLSRIYYFQNAFGNNDTIKLDINFLDRVHIYPTRNDTVSYFDKTVTLKTPSIEELFGMKINALIDRSKSRDLYDTNFVVDNIDLFNKEKLRKSIVFYLSLNEKFSIDEASFNKIKSITLKDIKKEIYPVIKKDERFRLDETKNKVIKMLSNLLRLKTNEKEYLVEFSKGNFNPYLLFEESIARNLLNHPMLKWRKFRIKKIKEGEKEDITKMSDFNPSDKW